MLAVPRSMPIFMGANVLLRAAVGRPQYTDGFLPPTRAHRWVPSAHARGRHDLPNRHRAPSRAAGRRGAAGRCATGPRTHAGPGPVSARRLDRRARGVARQAPADRLLERELAAHAHADEGLLAPVRAGRALAAAV